MTYIYGNEKILFFKLAFELIEANNTYCKSYFKVYIESIRI